MIMMADRLIVTVTRRQAAALLALASAPRDLGHGLTMDELGVMLGVSKQRAHQLVGELRDQGLVEFVRAGVHRGAVPTPDGVVWVERHRADVRRRGRLPLT